jgi:hypothetical protein
MPLRAQQRARVGSVPQLPRIDFRVLMNRWSRTRKASMTRGVRLGQAYGVLWLRACVDAGRRTMLMAQVRRSWTTNEHYTCVLFLPLPDAATSVVELSACECLYGCVAPRPLAPPGPRRAACQRNGRADAMCSHVWAVLWALFRSEPGPSHECGGVMAPWQSPLQFYEPWPRVGVSTA